MKKSSRFLAGFLAVMLAAQPVWAEAESEWLADTEAEVFDGEEFAAEENGFFDAYEGFDINAEGFFDESNLENQADFELPQEELEQTEFYMEDAVTAPIAVTEGSPSSAPAFFSNGIYQGSYGAQLEGEARRLYDTLAARYLTNYAAAYPLEWEYSMGNKIIFEPALDENGKVIQDENFAQAKAELKFIVQAAVDAFCYDYPEVFWFRGCNYSFSYGKATGTDGNTWGYIGEKLAMDLTKKEIYANAHREMGAFMVSVAQAADRLEAETAGEPLYEKIKKVHDYICSRVTYKNDGTLLVHTAAPAFIGEKRGVVCEGYAKAFKILCDRLGIPCACVSGSAKAFAGNQPIAHMWNYVRMENSRWYLVDTTWDDRGDKNPIPSVYYLAGWDSWGYDMKIFNERTEDSDLSASGNMRFTFPILSSLAYARDINNAVIRVSDQTYTGKPLTPGVQVTLAGAELKKDVDYTVRYENAQKAGTASVVITGLGDYEGIKQQNFRILPCSHTWTLKNVEEQPTCVQAGKSLYICTKCGDTNRVTLPKLPATVKLNISSVRLKVRQSFTVKVSGMGPGDKVASWSSSNKKVATVTSKGRIIARKVGKATLTVKLKSGLTKKLTVRVQKTPVKTTKIWPSTRKVTLAKKGKSYVLQAAVTPLTSREKVTFTSSNPRVARVNSQGKITAVRKGTATITVRSGTKKITCKVMVKR